MCVRTFCLKVKYTVDNKNELEMHIINVIVFSANCLRKKDINFMSIFFYKYCPLFMGKRMQFETFFVSVTFLLQNGIVRMLEGRPQKVS